MLNASLPIHAEKYNVLQALNGLHYEWQGTTSDQDGLPVIVVRNNNCHAVIAFQGAQVLEFSPQGKKPLLWMSSNAHFVPKRAIRGGVPLCFPWFGAHATCADKPVHGFARNVTWTLQDAQAKDDEHVLCFKLTDTEETRSIWPYAFCMLLEITLGKSLAFKWTIENTDSKPFEFTCALHSYFAVDDIHNTCITGLERQPYLDQLHPEQGDTHTELCPIRITAETDRIYQCALPRTQQQLGCYQIIQEDGARRYVVEAQHMPSVVVWNPWVEKTARFADMLPDAWQHMLCLECGHVAPSRIKLGAGESVHFAMVLRCE